MYIVEIANEQIAHLQSRYSDDPLCTVMCIRALGCTINGLLLGALFPIPVGVELPHITALCDLTVESARQWCAERWQRDIAAAGERGFGLAL